MESLMSRIIWMSKEINELRAKLNDLSKNTEEKNRTPYSKVGGVRDRSQIRPIDPSSSLGQVMGGNITWNDSELNIPPYGSVPVNPTKAYNLHSHSRYTGGALDKNTLEIVEYKRRYDDPEENILDVKSNQVNENALGLRKYNLEITNTTNSEGETIAKIGELDLVFNADIQKWGASAYEIDVEKCYLVKRDSDGEIEIDDNGNEMKATLWNDDHNKTCVRWDKNAQCWRIYAVFAEEDEEE